MAVELNTALECISITIKLFKLFNHMTSKHCFCLPLSLRRREVEEGGRGPWVGGLKMGGWVGRCVGVGRNPEGHRARPMEAYMFPERFKHCVGTPETSGAVGEDESRSCSPCNPIMSPKLKLVDEVYGHRFI